MGEHWARLLMGEHWAYWWENTGPAKLGVYYATRAIHSFKQSEWAISSFLSKNERFAQKPKSEFPSKPLSHALGYADSRVWRKPEVQG